MKIAILLIVTYFFQYFREIKKTVDATFKRLGQVEKCEDWCKSHGLLVTFDRQEKATCKKKCFDMAMYPPTIDLLCNIVCWPLDLFLNGKCIKSERCSYYAEVSDLDVTEAVKTRWLKAIKNKVKDQFK